MCMEKRGTEKWGKKEWKGKEERRRMGRERGVEWGRRQECNGEDKGGMDRKKRGTVKERKVE